ncbi:hypothetical protein imdm_2286 [gamma proteobacterium IMCC2047]|nr:hypothetical protein imdm_2286 [gamma proteobacterium IMCC2047]
MFHYIAASLLPVILCKNGDEVIATNMTDEGVLCAESLHEGGD